MFVSGMVCENLPYGQNESKTSRPIGEHMTKACFVETSASRLVFEEEQGKHETDMISCLLLQVRSVLNQAILL